MSCDYIFKYIIVGDSGVGKSCLKLQFTDGKFHPVLDLTIGSEFACRTVNVDGHIIKLRIWDTSGGICFKSMIKFFCRRAAGAIVVYDITRRETFENVVAGWLEFVQQQSENPNMMIMLVGTKSDLADQRSVSIEEGEQFAEENGFLFLETSAKTAQNVEQVFRKTAAQILLNIQHGVVDVSNECSGVKLGNRRHRGWLCVRDGTKSQIEGCWSGLRHMFGPFLGSFVELHRKLCSVSVLSLSRFSKWYGIRDTTGSVPLLN